MQGFFITLLTTKYVFSDHIVEILFGVVLLVF